MIVRSRKLNLHALAKTARPFVLVFLGVCPLAIAQTAPAPETAESLFKTNCVLCHGDDGSGTDLGKRFHVKDLRTKEVQDKTSEALAQTVRIGKDNMPPFGKRLNDDQIQRLIEYVRHLAPAAH